MLKVLSVLSWKFCYDLLELYCITLNIRQCDHLTLVEIILKCVLFRNIHFILSQFALSMSDLFMLSVDFTT